MICTLRCRLENAPIDCVELQYVFSDNLTRSWPIACARSVKSLSRRQIIRESVQPYVDGMWIFRLRRFVLRYRNTPFNTRNGTNIFLWATMQY